MRGYDCLGVLYVRIIYRIRCIVILGNLGSLIIWGRPVPRRLMRFFRLSISRKTVLNPYTTT